jgi:hypothetical protein
MFPANFVKVVVPLNDTRGNTSQQSQQSSAQVVTALYPFAAETWDDLEFQVSVTVQYVALWHHHHHHHHQCVL